MGRRAVAIGGGLVIAHPVGVIVGGGVTLGANATLFGGAVLGSSPHLYRDGSCEPTLGDSVTICTRGMVLGGVRVPDGTRVAAGRVVTTDL